MKGEVGKYQFLFLYLVFIFFVMTISAQAGAQLIKNAPPPPTLNLPTYPPFVSADELNNITGTNCFYETRVMFSPWIPDIGKRNTYKYCTPECINVQPECYHAGECSKAGALSCLIVTEAHGGPLGAYAGFFFDTLGYFFRLMGVSSEFMLFGILLIVPFIIVLAWIILELIVELIPF
ncbi:MAG: hypothetical protein QXF61_04390 [Nitrososphaeria archaeon]